MKSVIFTFISFLLLVSCQGIKDAGKVLRNEKTSSTDEFLVKKRKPLVLPPDYNEIPEPGSLSQKKKDEEETIKKILKATDEKNSEIRSPSSVEESILKKIRK